MSNDEKTTPAPAENVVLNNKEVEEKEATKQTALENNATSTPAEASSDNNGKTAQQVEPADGAAKETPTAAAPKPPKPTVHKVDFEKDVVYLYQFSRTKNIPSPSSFCLKVETWLRMAGIKYEVRNRRRLFFSFFFSSLVFHCPSQWLTCECACVCNRNPDDRTVYNVVSMHVLLFPKVCLSFQEPSHVFRVGLVTKKRQHLRTSPRATPKAPFFSKMAA